MNFRVVDIFLNFQVVKFDSKMFYFYLFSKPVLKILKHIAICRGTINTFHEYKLYYVENTLPRVLFINNNNKDTSNFSFSNESKVYFVKTLTVQNSYFTNEYVRKCVILL